MTQSVSIEQSAVSAFANYLSSKLIGLTVYDRWPEADVQLTNAITLIRSGRRTIEYTELDIVNEIPLDPTHSTFTWLVGFCTQPVQLDVWTTTDVDRDDALAQLDILLHAGATPAGFTNQNPVEAQTEISFDTGLLAGQADFRFDEPDLVETADAVGQREYRATFTGYAFFPLTVKADSAKIAQIILQQNI